MLLNGGRGANRCTHSRSSPDLISLGPLFERLCRSRGLRTINSIGNRIPDLLNNRNCFRHFYDNIRSVRDELKSVYSCRFVIESFILQGVRACERMTILLIQICLSHIARVFCLLNWRERYRPSCTLKQIQKLEDMLEYRGRH